MATGVLLLGESNVLDAEHAGLGMKEIELATSEPLEVEVEPPYDANAGRTTR